jgi:polyisoprenoid-binding protein YceI
MEAPMTRLPLALLLVSAAALADNYQIDPAHSNATFAVKHMMVSTVRGEFTKITGKVTLDEKDLTKSTLEATIDASTVNTREPKRDAHLKSPDFFDVAKFPTLSFKSNKVTKAGDKVKIAGDLTMHGVTKPVTFEATTPSKEMKDPWGNTRVAATATTKINRKDYGLNWNKALEAGGVLVGEEIAIEVNLELVKKADKKAER